MPGGVGGQRREPLPTRLERQIPHFFFHVAGYPRKGDGGGGETDMRFYRQLIPLGLMPSFIKRDPHLQTPELLFYTPPGFQFVNLLIGKCITDI